MERRRKRGGNVGLMRWTDSPACRGEGDSGEARRRKVVQRKVSEDIGATLCGGLSRRCIAE